MFKKVILCMLLLIFPFISSSGIFAQECNPPYEMVTRLHKPEPGAYTVWDAVYGAPEYDEAFHSVLPLNDGGVLAVGERTSVDGASKTIVFVTFDRLGRQLSETFFMLDGLKDVVKILKRPERGYAVLVNIVKNNRGQAWLGFFDEDLKLLSQKTISESNDEVRATDIVPSAELGWVISVSLRRGYGEGVDRIEIENGRVYLLDRSGAVVRERSYSPGGNNHISSLAVLDIKGKARGYIATGYFVNNNGKQIAWTLRLDLNLALNWQREASRGISAKFNVAYGYLDDYVLAFGDVVPVNGRPTGTWLALLDVDDGSILWQRYYYGEGGTHGHSARGVFVNEDNLIVLMMMAQALTKPTGDKDDYLPTDYMDYAHLLTLSPRGITMSGDTYFFGLGARIAQLIEGMNGERIMAGYVLVLEDVTGAEDDNKDADYPLLQEEGRVFLPDVELSSKAKKGLELLQKKISVQEAQAVKELAKRENGLMKKGWIVIGDRLDTYKDPCSK